MSKIVWLPRAEKRLNDVLFHISEENPSAAERLSVAIHEQVSILAEHPQIGHPGRQVGTRELVVHSHYILLYRVRKDRVEIMTVLHTSQEWPTK